MLSVVAVRLTLVWTVDTVEADAFSLAVVQNSGGIAVEEGTMGCIEAL